MLGEIEIMMPKRKEIWEKWELIFITVLTADNLGTYDELQTHYFDKFKNSECIPVIKWHMTVKGTKLLPFGIFILSYFLKKQKIQNQPLTFSLSKRFRWEGLLKEGNLRILTLV